jgi:peptidoglycan-N-acetylglucosamine deacetylase
VKGELLVRLLAGLWLMAAPGAGAAAVERVSASVDEAVRRALEANRAAPDYHSWMADPYSPHRLVAGWMQAGESMQRTACAALSQLADHELELFEQALLLAGEDALKPCREALLKRLVHVPLNAVPSLPPAPQEPAPDGGRSVLGGERPHCPGNKEALGTARVVEVAPGKAYGSMQRFARLDLAPGELVFTFDDGPLPPVTQRVLAVLDKHCVRATFFSVGKMASAYPDVIRLVQSRGHVVGNHTWNHAILSRQGHDTATDYIEKGKVAIDRVLSATPHSWLPGAKAGIAPFFRFPGLGHNRKLIGHVTANGMSIFSCDICIDDWKSYTDETLLKLALKEIEAHGRGIVLLHDIQRRTARILPALFEALAKKGYRAVHMVPQGWLSAPVPRPAAQTVSARE